MAGAQAIILAELESQFGGSAVAARDTFGGALKSLDNTIGDVQETLGGFVANAARPFVESMNEMWQGVNEFLESEEGIKQITAVLAPLAGIGSVIMTVFGTVFDAFKDFVDNIAGNLVDEFTDLNEEGETTNVVLAVLGGVVQGIASAFAILASFVNLAVTNTMNLAKAVVDTALVVDAFLKAISGHPLQSEADKL
ncbi:unnamed protein product [marine sediment metagenome]|uniref:Uncharacterized protein n=2 Tax=marine sediment metagenome TaxID=412755 RepID=X1GHB7_9ZZZZ